MNEFEQALQSTSDNRLIVETHIRVMRVVFDLPIYSNAAKKTFNNKMLNERNWLTVMKAYFSNEIIRLEEEQLRKEDRKKQLEEQNNKMMFLANEVEEDNEDDNNNNNKNKTSPTTTTITTTTTTTAAAAAASKDTEMTDKNNNEENEEGEGEEEEGEGDQEEQNGDEEEEEGDDEEEGSDEDYEDESDFIITSKSPEQISKVLKKRYYYRLSIDERIHILAYIVNQAISSEKIRNAANTAATNRKAANAAATKAKGIDALAAKLNTQINYENKRSARLKALYGDRNNQAQYQQKENGSLDNVSLVTTAQPLTFIHLSDVHYSSLVNSIDNNSTTRCLSLDLEKQAINSISTIYRYNSPAVQAIIHHEGDDHGEPYIETIPHDGLFGRYGCDTNMELFNSTLNAMLSVNPDPTFIIYTGDSAGHSLPYNFWEESQITFAKYMAATYPGTTIIPSIGNNDVFPDYNVTCSDNNLQFLSQVWNQWIPVEQMPTFLKMGAFAISPTPGLVVLSLNTVLYSTKQKTLYQDPCGQFQWLETQLAMAQENNQSVYIIGHIYPGLDPFYQQEQWSNSYIVNFYNLMSNYNDVIKGGFFGHIHRDEFRSPQYVQNTNTSDSSSSSSTSDSLDQSNISSYNSSNPYFPLFIGSAISPLYENNPSFKQFYFDDNQNIVSYDTYYTDIYISNLFSFTNWTLEYSFAELYDISDPYVDGSTLRNLVDYLNLNRYLYAIFDIYRTSSYEADISPTFCLILNPTDTAFNRCLTKNNIIDDIVRIKETRQAALTRLKQKKLI
ncbi:putative sphingomyelinase [Heterostelium album PN500]|uniref:Putative sphingomyelinase n=1 Tax=Heterostelium pallidum (strain ATCC 26659 / Pp 5 / PN500) TaxID=670386 RepID=D3BN86_HETP5|nr:putative sphingomyelinase [Heterostelium album PN500]EFA76746.1 putative sphingomyelinase [Heterostelium album PN500]|eukprot:XP_020428878.1 putative sphingomyelinase [Heterostelium album PN500]